MVGKRKNEDAPPLPAEVQPSGSGAVPGSAQGAEEMSVGTQLKAGAAGQQVAPGTNDGTAPELGDTEADMELATAAEEPMVLYRGAFRRREISVQDWQRANVPDMPLVVWELRTGFKVPKSVFSDQALQVLRQDPDFVVQ